MSRLFHWRWSFGLGAAATAAVLILATILATPGSRVSAAEILARGASALAGLRSIHFRGTLRTPPADNFSAIAPDQEPVLIEFWKEFTPVVRWRAEKPGRIAVMDGRSTMLFLRPDYARKFDGPSQSAFDTGWLHEIANLGQALQTERDAIQKHGWPATVTREPAPDGKTRTVVTVEAKAGYPNDDYLKNAFFCTADTRRVYTFDEESGRLLAAKILLPGPAGEKVLFELGLIEADPALATGVFELALPPDVTWAEDMPILPDNARYEAMTPEEAARTFFEACGREDWTEAGKFYAMGRSVKSFYGGLQLVSLGKAFTSLVSLVNGAQFVPYEIRLKSGDVRRHNLALKRDPRTRRWFVDGGI